MDFILPQKKERTGLQKVFPSFAGAEQRNRNRKWNAGNKDA
jgi:hypothetical protein